MSHIYLALVWHQHQPYYKDLVTGHSPLPWVRLHGIKDYIGMLALAREVPELRQTINLVPSLIVQIEDYLSGGSDQFLEATRIPADSLGEENIRYILDHFFMAHWANMVNVHARYGELLAKRAPGRKSVERVWKRFSTDELRDLQVWANLAWFHPTVVEQDPVVSGLIAKGRDFSEDDKAAVIGKQFEVLGRVIPVHKELQDAGQLEVTTTPFYHPILPLLWDIDLARAALPQMVVPQLRSAFREDVPVHVNRAVACYRERFGCPPRGMWPAEGSVCTQIIPALAEAGIEWIATDEEILGLSVGVCFDRNSSEEVIAADALYRPYKVLCDGAAINAVFRDHVLSDLLGFKYQWMPPDGAVGNFLARLDRIRRHHPGRDHLVSVILDGENPWESYRNSGVDFLRLLYRQLASTPWITTVRVADYLGEHPPEDPIEHLFAGSWISHNFATWVGHREKNLGWEYLDRTRAFLEQETARRQQSGEPRPGDAWEELYIAEGSDWFWWFGDDHFSGNDEAFDELFREHLKNVYRLAGADPPGFLSNTILQVGRAVVYSEPRTFLDVKLDGRPTSYFEWASAGRYERGRDAGTMHKASGHVVGQIYFGFDEQVLYLRFDLELLRSEDEPAPAGPAIVPWPVVAGARVRRPRLPTPPEMLELWKGIELTVCFAGAAEAELILSDLAGPQQAMTLAGLGEGAGRKTLDSFALKQILEVAVRFDDLGLKPGDEFEFAVEVSRHGSTVQRAPENTSIRLKVPTADFESLMWQV